MCGRRRLAAIQKLNWRVVNVWVRQGISDRLGHLLAEQDDNLLHKDLTPLEAASLYRELKALLAEDAARRQDELAVHQRPPIRAAKRTVAEIFRHRPQRLRVRPGSRRRR